MQEAVKLSFLYLITIIKNMQNRPVVKDSFLPKSYAIFNAE